MTGRVVARRVLERVFRDKAWATLALDAELKTSGLDERERRLASELTYGVLRHQQRIDQALSLHANLNKTPAKVKIALQVAAYQLLMLDRVPDYAIVDDAVAASKAVSGSKVGGFVNAVLRKVKAAGFAPLPSDPVLAASMPLWIATEVQAALASDGLPADQLSLALSALNVAPTLTLRVNRRAATVAEVLAKLGEHGVVAEPHALSPDALCVRGAGDPALLPGFINGTFTVQDAAAQRVALLAAPQVGERVLDACAGVGGKSCQLADLQNDQGRVDATDLSSTKLALASAAALRMGLSSVHTQQADLLGVLPIGVMAPTYSLVVLDAPCTGLGVLRRHPDAKMRLQPAQVSELAALQQKLIDQVWPLVAQGGRLLYSVCSFSVQEGPAQIAAALQRHIDMQLSWQERTWPHLHDCDAFYLAQVVKI
jgi:16S rRNA (cytosine967-C5)-methyltransferase